MSDEVNHGGRFLNDAASYTNGISAAGKSKPCPYVTGTVTKHCTLTPFTLTDAEREAVRFCTTAALPETEKLSGVVGELCRMHAATLRGLLERTK